MIDIDSKYFPLIASIIGVLGIALGTLLTEIRGWFETRRNNKRILKSALYHQLQLFGEMLALDRDTAKEFAEALRNITLTLGASEESTNKLFGEMPNEIFSIMEVAKAEALKDAVEKHEETIIKLSEVDPLFATNWSYRSRSRLPDQFKIFLGEASTISTETNEITEKFVAHIKEWFQAKSQKKLMESLEKGILEIAWKIDLRTWWKMKGEMHKWRQTIKSDIHKEAQEYVQEIISFSMQNFEMIQNGMQTAIEEGKSNKRKQKKIVPTE